MSAESVRLSIPLDVIENMLGVAQNGLSFNEERAALRLIYDTLRAEYRGTKAARIDGSIPPEETQ